MKNMAIGRLLGVILLAISPFFLSEKSPAQCGPGQICGPNGCPPVLGIFNQGQIPQQSQFSGQPLACVARIKISFPGCHQYGSGSLIDKNQNSGLIVTTDHCFISDRRQSHKSISVMLPEGEFSGVLVGRDAEWDLALIAIQRPIAEPIVVASTPALQGDPVWCIGYGSGTGQYRQMSSRVQGYVSSKTGGKKNTLRVTGQARDGDSGGPIVNAQSELVAVLWGTGQHEAITVGTYSDQMKVCIERFLVPWNAQAATDQARIDLEREQALMELIRQNQGGSSPILEGRVSALESRVEDAISMAEQYLQQPSQIPVLPVPVTPVMPPSRASPVMPTHTDAHASEALTGSSGAIWVALTAWLRTIGLSGSTLGWGGGLLLAFFLFSKFGWSKFIRLFSRRTVRTGINGLDKIIERVTATTTTKLDDKAGDWLIALMRKAADFGLGKLDERTDGRVEKKLNGNAPKPTS